MVLPAIVTAVLVARYVSDHNFGVDFRHDFWVAGWDVRAGLSPYDWTRQQIRDLVAFPYPPLAALFFVPFSLLGKTAALVLFELASAAAGFAALRVLGVRDWRVYAVVLLWWPVINVWQTANVTLLFACGIAVVWRHRDNPWVVGALSALMLSIKPIVWPLFIWLLVSRRYRSIGAAVLVGVPLNLIGWTILGSTELVGWWHMLGRENDVLYSSGYGFPALAAHLGASRFGGTVLEVAVAAAVAAVCLYLGKLGRDAESFSAAVILMLVASPLVDNHYFALLIVPLALRQRRFAIIWLIPLVLWLCPATGVATWQIFLSWATVAAVAYTTCFESGRRVSNPRPSAWEADALPTELRPRG